MGQIKAWQGIVVGLALLMLAGSLYFTFGRGEGEVKLANSVTMVDVTTGDLFEYSVSGRRGVMVPEKHPDSGKLVLFPVEREESPPPGRWVIGSRARGVLGDSEEEPTAVNRQTGEVTVSGNRLRRIR